MIVVDFVSHSKEAESGNAANQDYIVIVNELVAAKSLKVTIRLFFLIVLIGKWGFYF